ncbi:MAG: type II secretion system protein [Candidatus Kerfeldbacteria bacterium]|nr:type II secretion system protein [Candidatus Kerfeldbacteria bacterium]
MIYSSQSTRRQGKKGFTLLELLIVIAILAILGTVLVLVLNPAETLKKSRDTQRISDMATLKTALALYTTTILSPDLDAGATFKCLSGTATDAMIAYSKPQAGAILCTADVVPGADASTSADFSASDYCYNVVAANSTLVDGTGWLPVNLGSITGGSPISNMPLDPTNTIATDTTPIMSDLVYRYACQSTSTTKSTYIFELNARLESSAYGPSGSDDRSAKDGGDNDVLYEVGTSVRLLGSGTNF